MRAQAALTLMALPLLAGCGGGGAASGEGDARFVSGVRHAYFPLTPGARWVLEGEEDGLLRREEVRVLEETRRSGTTECTAVAQDVFLDGLLAETTTEWFAEDDTGNVWKFGEESVEFDESGVGTTADSWFAGVDGARAFLAFPARLRVGEVFHGYRPDGVEEFRVLSLTDAVSVPAGDYVGCLRLWENPFDVEDADVLLYAPGVGRVSEETPSGGVVLVSASGV